MNLLISKTTTLIYRFVVKPIMFRVPPDRVHTDVIKLGSFVQRYSFFRWLISSCWSYSNPKLSQNILGIDFKNPVGLSAGFDKNIELSPTIKSVGFGFMEGGTTTFQASEGNKRPWYYRLPKTKSLVVHAGLPNQGTKRIMKRVDSFSKNTYDNFPLNVSVAQSNVACVDGLELAIDDYENGIKEIVKSSRVKMITLNISCPNTYDGEPFSNPEAMEKLLKRVDSLKIKQPIFLKMPSHIKWKQFDELLEVIKNHKVAGITVSNLAHVQDVHFKDVLPEGIKGGFSGKPTFKLSNDLIYQTRKKYGDRFVIIGVGGIFSADDAYTKIKLGASLVEMITGVIFEGPQIIGQINHGLVQRLTLDGFNSIDEAVGSAISTK
jgi:dihydroorotate dehydrogenase (fumarate)